MEMIDRYIYAVTQKLPHSQREDIAIELRGLIEDMIEERIGDGKITKKVVEEILLELGSPRKMAQKYRGTKKYVIGPELYDPFLIILKIVLLSTAGALGIVFVIQTVINPVEILDHFIGLIVALVTGIPQAVGWITLVFALVEYYGGVKTKELGLEKTWHPSMLSAIPDQKRRIKRSEPIVAIIFYVIVMVLFAFSSNFFGVYVFNESEFREVVPFLNEETFSQYMPFVLLLLAIFIVKECLKLISGKWTMKLVAYTLIINLLGIIVVSLLITGDAFWNPNFMSELIQAGVVAEGSEGYHIGESIWINSTRITVIILLVGLVWDTIEGLIKARKK
jgi:hypothetical protein